MIATGYVLVGLAGLFILLAAYPAALFLCIAAGALALLGPTDAQRDARGRNPRPPQARRVR